MPMVKVMPLVYISVVEQMLNFFVMVYDLIRSFIVTIVRYIGISPSLQYEVSALVSTLFLFLSLMAVWIVVQKVRGKRKGKKVERTLEQHPYMEFPLPALEIEEGRLEDTLNSITELRAEGKISEEEYFQMCAYKTGTLARMAAKMACVIAGADDSVVETMGKFAESLGIAFQIQDDILDLVGEEFAKGKGGLGKDITEGKLTLMVIHTIKKASASDRKKLIEILEAHTSDEAEKNKAISIIKRYGSIEYAKKVAADIVKNSWAEVDKVLPPSEAKEKLRSLARYLIERKI